jgi:hypothetical protein
MQVETDRSLHCINEAREDRLYGLFPGLCPGIGECWDYRTLHGARADDASREIEDRLLQGQQPHRIVSVCVLHFPRLHISSEEGTEQAKPAIYLFPAGCEQGYLEADATDSAWVGGN